MFSDQVAALFYERLFALDPSLKTLFKGDFQEQRRKLMHMFSLLIARLDNLSAIVPLLQNLGRNHAASYGVMQEHYDEVGKALLWALEKQLQKRFTPEVKAAWTDVYQLIATIAVEAAYKS
jgi:hemoglobin-like flavoprotein